MSLALLVAAACGGAPQKVPLRYADRAQRDYELAMDDFRDGDCAEAEPAFKQIKRKYPFSRFSNLSELRIADCHMKESKYLEAIQAYRQFIRFHPTHAEVPYAAFRAAEAHFLQIPDDWFLSPPAYERDQSSAKEAFVELQQFARDYPDDRHMPKVIEMAKSALGMLAKHELYVAEYYLDRDKPDAAVGRLESMLRIYPGSGLEPEALILLGRVFLQLRRTDDARHAFTLLTDKFPESGYAAQARAYLQTLGRNPS